tara:strand:+ start:552 stop:1010 length:459 start_codon:yes stop_codon:yes gene_type:complete
MISNISNLTLETFVKEILSLIISFSVGIFIITYLFNLPSKITGDYDIVYEYYIKNFIKSIPADLFFVFVYFVIAGIFMKFFNLKSDIDKLMTVALTTIILTGLACYYFKSNKLTDSFFSRWFHSVGYSSIIYDVLLLVFIYACFLFIKRKIQ